MQHNFINNMPEVREYQASLNRISERWNLLTLLGQMSNIGMDMSETRQGFQELTDRLLERLTNETLSKVTAEMDAKAQVAVDIVIRNLFERTADIGFLSTDDDIRRYIQEEKLNLRDNDEARFDHKKHHDDLVSHFKEYVAKYSVYNDIVLLNTSGKVLAQLNDANKLDISHDPIIQEALNTNQDYVEIFRHSDLQAHQEKSLIYAFRVTENNQNSSESIGVLCLIFRFENEMESVFSDLLDGSDDMVLTLLDKSGEVISSSDAYHIPIGVKLKKVLNTEFEVVRFAGRKYLSKTCATNGYEGFQGLGWYGHAMVPIDSAFEKNDAETHEIKEELMRKLVSASTLFSDDLVEIPHRAERIQRELDITVWNGNVQIANTKAGDNSFSKTLLNEISNTGVRTKKIFEDSISDLNQTVISSYFDVAEFHAHLAIDIMDRNLYERANDCRWWALTTRFCEILSDDEYKEEDLYEMSEILSYINNLYTVYTNLFIYDKHGIIKATSSSSQKNIIGEKLSNEWVNKTLNLKSSQDYSVSDFEESTLYGNAHTYIYSAAISCKKTGRASGGIGVVFDSEPQFFEMLHDALPKDENGSVIEGCFGVLINENKKVITSTSESYKVGTSFSIEEKYLSESVGKQSDIIIMNDHYYVLGVSKSVGYREYKVSDCYSNKVMALVFIEIGKVEGVINNAVALDLHDIHYPKVQGNEEYVELSTFIISGKLYALESKYIVCSLFNQEITSVLGADDFYMGLISYNNNNIPIISLRSEISGDTTYNKNNDCIIITEVDNGNNEKILVGLVIDSVADSPEMPVRYLSTCENITSSGSGKMTKYIIQPIEGDEQSVMTLVIDIEFIAKSVFKEDVDFIENESTTKLLDNKGV